MKNLTFIFLISLLAQTSCNTINDSGNEINPSQTLRYNEPAKIWTEALPLGNGRLGAMVYGGTENEIIQFNEETLWTGQPHDYAHKGAYKYLGELRKLLWDGKQDEAHKLANEQFMSQPFGQQAYQPFGDILLNFPGHEKATNYERQLNLVDAVTSVKY
ncbi:MAG TPA: glycoside hydrolase family 95 protein, partial [Draconibacterium sp.]|nr:glycoside hydrolase family 95 protein [Draconibacterium sp.]